VASEESRTVPNFSGGTPETVSGPGNLHPVFSPPIAGEKCVGKKVSPGWRKRLENGKKGVKLYLRTRKFAGHSKGIDF
jgi:hypothetical protein